MKELKKILILNATFITQVITNHVNKLAYWKRLVTKNTLLKIMKRTSIKIKIHDLHATQNILMYENWNIFTFTL